MSERTQPDSDARARVRALVLVAAGSALTGPLVGALWAWIAPPIRAVVARPHADSRNSRS